MSPMRQVRRKERYDHDTQARHHRYLKQKVAGSEGSNIDGRNTKRITMEREHDRERLVTKKATRRCDELRECKDSSTASDSLFRKK
jgi:hypothetical protein